MNWSWYFARVLKSAERKRERVIRHHRGKCRPDRSAARTGMPYSCRVRDIVLRTGPKFVSVTDDRISCKLLMRGWLLDVDAAKAAAAAS